MIHYIQINRGILTMPSQYILSLITFLANNLEYFTFQSSIHEIKTSGRVQMQKPIDNLTSYQRGVYYASIKTTPVYLYYLYSLRTK
jgi:hypothetical protein